LLADSLTLDDGGAFADDINFNCQDGIISDLLLDDDDGLSTLPPSLPLDKINIINKSLFETTSALTKNFASFLK